MKNQYTLTDKFLPIYVGLGLAYEAGAIATNGETISACVWKWSQRYALIPFLLGLLCGHLTWQQFIAPAQQAQAVDKAIKECKNA